MDKTALVDKDREEMRKLVAALLASGLPVAAAMSLREKGSMDWRLFVASPDVEKHGPTVVYRFIDRIVKRLRIDLDLNRVVAANTTNHFVNKIVSYLGSGSRISNLTNFVVDDTEVEEALIYHIAPRVKASRMPPRADEVAVRKAKQAA